jgi:hypothetical protein
MPKSDKIIMSKADLLKEHVKLIKLLKTGTRMQQMKEAASQAQEMLKYKPKK